MSDGLAASTIGEVDNAIYFTQEQFTVRLRFPVPSLVKRFLHLTRAPPALVRSRFLDSNGFQCVGLSPLAGHLTGGDLFHLHFEAWDWGSPIYVGTQSSTAICNRGSLTLLKRRQKGLSWLEACGA